MDTLEFDEWEKSVPDDLKADTIWRLPAYRLSLYLCSAAQSDLQRIVQHRATRALGDQLLRSVGGISASIDEGYSRSSGVERAHFYEYALGSAREARGWYWKCSIALPAALVAARIAMLTRIIRILTAIIPRERALGTAWRRKRDASVGTSNPQ